MRKILTAIAVIALLFTLSACSDRSIDKGLASDQNDSPNTEQVTGTPEISGSDQVTEVPEEQEEFQPVDVSADGWNIIIEGSMRDSSMKNAAVVLGYTAVTTNEFVQEAPDGKEYFLIKMKISKDESDASIQWDKLALTDGDGNTYNRIDDIFIEDLGMKRLPGTDLNFGSHEGWLAFEVDEAAEGLTMHYDFPNGSINYTFE